MLLFSREPQASANLRARLRLTAKQEYFRIIRL
jgi:hypothetical protein